MHGKEKKKKTSIPAEKSVHLLDSFSLKRLYTRVRETTIKNENMNDT